MSKHRAETAEPLPTLAATLPSAPSPRDDPSLLDPVIAPAALNLPRSSNPIPAPVLTTPRRSRVDVATPVSVLVACYVTIAMCLLHAVVYASMAVQFSSARAHVSATNPKLVTGLWPGATQTVKTSGVLTLLILVTFTLVLLCLAVAGTAYVATRRSPAARIALIMCAGGSAMVSLGPVFGDGSLWWALTLLTGAGVAGVMAWNGWWFAESRKLR